MTLRVSQEKRITGVSGIIVCLLLIPALLFLPGCNPFSHDPEKTVIIEISPITRNSDREEIAEILSGMTDGSGHTMTIRTNGDKMTVRLSPVRDIEAFARRINFGRVERIEDRTITIHYAPSREYI